MTGYLVLLQYEHAVVVWRPACSSCAGQTATARADGRV